MTKEKWILPICIKGKIWHVAYIQCLKKRSEWCLQSKSYCQSAKVFWGFNAVTCMLSYLHSLKIWILVINMAKVSKNDLNIYHSISVPNTHFQESFRKFFPIMALRDVMKGGTPYMGISPRRVRPCMHRPEREQERARACIDRSESKRESALINALYPAALHGIHSGSMSLKKCVFGCEGKITLFSFPKNPALREQWMQFVFSGQQRSFSSVFVDDIYKPGPVRRWICTWFDTERWSGPSYERSRSWFRTSDGKWNCIKRLFCWRLEQMLVTL